MTLDEFWAHIHATKRNDDYAHVRSLVERLAALPPDEIIDFDHWWDLMKSEAYHWNLWGAAYTIGGGCSDDGFSDFRSWLILQGREVFQAAVTDPDTLVDHVRGRSRCECNPGSNAWFQATKTPHDRAGYDAMLAASQARHPLRESARDDMGEDWNFDDEDEVRKRLPRIAARYIDHAGRNES